MVNLTVVSVCMYGAEVVNAVHKGIMSSPHIRKAFNACCAGAREQAALAHVHIGMKETEMLHFILKKYLRLRGKDFVRSLVSEFKRRTDTNVSLRAKLAVTTANSRAAVSQPVVENATAAADMGDEEVEGAGGAEGEGKEDANLRFTQEMEASGARVNADGRWIDARGRDILQALLDGRYDGSDDIGGALPLT